MNEVFVVRKIEKKETKKIDETSITYKALLEGDDFRMVLLSENPFSFELQDELVLRLVKAQKKI